MHPSFREAMNWLHTWAGVVLGALIFAIFWMGTLSVFDREIDRWMMPMTRFAAPSGSFSYDTIRPAADRLAIEAASPQWYAFAPTERVPTVQIGYRPASGFVGRHIDPGTGAPLPDAGTWGGTRFIFPFHYRLHLTFWDIGYWLVGLAGMAMLALLVTGVVIHIRIFRDFFTFRPSRKAGRGVLDLHNLAGVLGLPFHLMITLSGLIIFFSIYFPSGWHAAYKGDRQAFLEEAYGRYKRPVANAPGKLASLDAMVAEASRAWDGDPPYFVRVWHPGDANAYVEVRRAYENAVTMHLDLMYFDGPTGKLLHSFSSAPVMTAERFISGLHFIQFRHWSLRWIYFALGLTGCALIASGFLFWIESRRKRHAQLGLAGVRVVEGLTVGATTGIILATLGFFIANRLLPLGLENRIDLEIGGFCLAWAAGFAHAWWRSRQAWAEQCWAIAVAALAAVALNAITTGDHLPRALANGLWAVAGMDLMLIAAALIAVLTARALGRRAEVARPSATTEAARA
jgi:uncharacterized iron-regulated membrane protein